MTKREVIRGMYLSVIINTDVGAVGDFIPVMSLWCQMVAHHSVPMAVAVKWE